MNIDGMFCMYTTRYPVATSSTHHFVHALSPEWGIAPTGLSSSASLGTPAGTHISKHIQSCHDNDIESAHDYSMCVSWFINKLRIHVLWWPIYNYAFIIRVRGRVENLHNIYKLIMLMVGLNDHVHVCTQSCIYVADTLYALSSLYVFDFWLKLMRELWSIEVSCLLTRTL